MEEVKRFHSFYPLIAKRKKVLYHHIWVHSSHLWTSEALDNAIKKTSFPLNIILIENTSFKVTDLYFAKASMDHQLVFHPLLAPCSLRWVSDSLWTQSTRKPSPRNLATPRRAYRACRACRQELSTHSCLPEHKECPDDCRATRAGHISLVAYSSKIIGCCWTHWGNSLLLT